MFVKKYRKHDFTKIIGLPKNLPKIDKDMPHLLLYGKQGTGKSLLSETIQKTLGWQTLHLNGSDTRGIDTIRETVKSFMMTQSHDSNPKLLRLEEADSLTLDAQKILRELLETYANNCKVIFTLNYPNKIIDPLKSRCVCINMDEKDKQEIVDYLVDICSTEGIKFKDGAISLIIEKFYPDIRSMINKLEEFKDKEITPETIVLDESKIKGLFELFLKKNFTEAYKWCLDCSWGYPEIIQQMFKYTLKSNLDSNKKLKLITELAEIDFRMGMSTDKEVQMASGLVQCIKAVN